MNQDSTKIIEDNLDSIEKSKEQVKKYINHFVSHVQVVHQDRKYSVVEVKIKDYTQNKFWKMIDILSETKVHKYTYLVIDKRVTRKVKIYSMSQFGDDNAAIHVKGMADMFVHFLLKALDRKDYGDIEPIPFNRLVFQEGFHEC